MIEGIAIVDNVPGNTRSERYEELRTEESSKITLEKHEMIREIISKFDVDPANVHEVSIIMRNAVDWFVDHLSFGLEDMTSVVKADLQLINQVLRAYLKRLDDIQGFVNSEIGSKIKDSRVKPKKRQGVV